MIIKNKQNIIQSFKEMLNSQKSLSKLIENKNIFSKTNILPLYDELKKIDKNLKKDLGQELNEIKKTIDDLFEIKKQTLEEQEDNKENVVDYDLSLDTSNLNKGTKTILSIVLDEIIDYFKKLNFKIIEGDEVVTIDNNMDKLNIDLNHPARANKDSFYIDDKFMLRTHCTANTADAIYNQDNEVKVLSYGNVYRNDDDDLTHSHQFTQVDIIWVKKNLTINHLKTIIDGLLMTLFGKDIKTRYRLSYFPFTEPSFEVDISCFSCGGKGCLMCKQSGWIEILGAGMLHRNVLKMANITSTDTALAAGMGIERIAMLKYGITDIRNIYNNDFRLVQQLRKRG